jgi:hypothetical protein
MKERIRVYSLCMLKRESQRKQLVALCTYWWFIIFAVSLSGRDFLRYGSGQNIVCCVNEYRDLWHASFIYVLATGLRPGAFSGVVPCSLIDRRLRGLIMEAVRTAETSIYFNETTRLYIPEYCHIHILSRESLKSRITVRLSFTRKLWCCALRYTTTACFQILSCLSFMRIFLSR